MLRWTFALPDASESYTVEVNPNAAESALAQRQLTWEASRLGFTGRRAGRAPTQWEFSGVLRSQAQYEAILGWLAKRRRVVITTDLGQSYTVRLVAFSPTQERTRRQAPHRHTYTVQCLILDGS